MLPLHTTSVLDKQIKLSSSQKSAIAHNSGHLRIIACPGSGKTETVSRRVVRLIKTDVKPSSIVAFTFTVKAANELKTRIHGMLEIEYGGKFDFGGMHIGTIDAFCLHMLKKIKPEYENFEILDDARRTAFIYKWRDYIGIKNIEKYKGEMPIFMFCSSFDRLMTEQIDLSRLSKPAFVECCKRYKEKLREEKFFDFVSIIHEFLGMLKNDVDVLQRVNDEIKHVVFDEYQDGNLLQEKLLEFLSKGTHSVCVVGDDDQNIFQWRGSNVEHIKEFPERYKKYGVTSLALDINYRATDELIKMSAQFITKNKYRIKKDMRANERQHNRFEYGDIFHRHFNTDEEEFGFICKTMQGMRNTGFVDRSGTIRPLSYRDMAVIVRNNNDATRIIEIMSKLGIRYVADSGTSVFRQPVVLLAVNSILYAFECNGHKMNKVPDLENLVRNYSDSVPKGDPNHFKKNLEEAKEIAVKIMKQNQNPNLGMQEFYHRILSAMGAERGAFSEEDLSNLAVLSKIISDYEYIYKSERSTGIDGLKWLIEYFSRKSYSNPIHNNHISIDAVRVMTIWKAKGLEFPVVFLPSFDDRPKFLPQKYFVDADLYQSKRYEDDEEYDRRLFYTGVTRAQKCLFLTSAEKLKIKINDDYPKDTRKPHKFLEEMKNDKFSADLNIERSKIKETGQEEQGEIISSTYNEMSIYERCPYDYWLRHVIGFNKGVPFAFGYSANIRSILNYIHKNYKNKKNPNEEEISEIFDDMFYLRFASMNQTNFMKQNGIKTITKYVNLHGEDFGRILETEKQFEFLLKDVLLSGSIDLLKQLDGNTIDTEIIDFKTNRSADDEEYEIDHAEQVRFHAYAALTSLGYKPNKAAVHHLDTQEKEEVDISGQKLETTEKKIIQKVLLMAAGQFKPEPEEYKCGKCDFKALCEHKGFEVGVNFKSARSGKRKNGAAESGDE